MHAGWFGCHVVSRTRRLQCLRVLLAFCRPLHPMMRLYAALLLFPKMELNCAAFSHHTSLLSPQVRHTIGPHASALGAKAKKKKKGGGGTSAGVKGFGSSASSTTTDVAMDRSKDTLTFYDYMEKNGAGDNLKRVALGYFPLPGGGSLRGVVALRDAKKGDVLIRIPYEMAVNLGPEGEDPTLPGMTLLNDYCQTLQGEGEVNRTAYFRLLPPFMGDDCMGSTDFFSDDALDSLQAPLVVDETLQRRERTKNRLAEALTGFPTWIDGTAVTEEHLRWAVWLITSRVLTVQGDAEEGRSYRLLIPFLDMCNHDRSSPHVLTGRAVPGGELKVVAGAPIQAGEQLNICYGGGVAGNDRFLQDYGFLDSEVAFDMVAQQLLGKRRIMEGVGGGRTIPAADAAKTLEQLRTTTMKQDEGFLDTETDHAIRCAIVYRLGVKRALSKYMDME